MKLIFATLTVLALAMATASAGTICTRSGNTVFCSGDGGSVICTRSGNSTFCN
jgi:hypothetical protein